jgi:hypothetical protein
MEYSRLIAVTGIPGLFELITSKNDGAIVKSLEDGTTKFVSSRVHQFSHLESIEIYTTGDNVNLIDVLKAMAASSEAIPSEKDAAAVKAYLLKVYPNIDADRVYVSDMKKIVKWYGVLKANNVELKLSSDSESDAEAIEANAEPVTEAAIATPEAAETEQFGNAPADPAEAAKKKKAPKKIITEEKEAE